MRYLAKSKSMSMPSKQNLRTGTLAEGTGRMSVTSSVNRSTSVHKSFKLYQSQHLRKIFQE